MSGSFRFGLCKSSGPFNSERKEGGFIPLSVSLSVGSALFTQGGGKCYICHFLSLLSEIKFSFGQHSSALHPRRGGEELSKY